MENKASESSEGKFQKSNIFLNSTFNNDNLWIAILIVYFIAIIVACLSFAYYNWQGTQSHLMPYVH
jgi:type IV secretory pathway TrbF-like protein